MIETEYDMVMPFLTDNVDWVEGFECGAVYQQLKDRIDVIENYYHSANLKQIKAMAEHFNYTCFICHLGSAFSLPGYSI